MSRPVTQINRRSHCVLADQRTQRYDPSRCWLRVSKATVSVPSPSLTTAASKAGRSSACTNSRRRLARSSSTVQPRQVVHAGFECCRQPSKQTAPTRSHDCKDERARSARSCAVCTDSGSSWVVRCRWMGSAPCHALDPVLSSQATKPIGAPGWGLHRAGDHRSSPVYCERIGRNEATVKVFFGTASFHCVSCGIAPKFACSRCRTATAEREYPTSCRPASGFNPVHLALRQAPRRSRWSACPSCARGVRDSPMLKAGGDPMRRPTNCDNGWSWWKSKR